MSPLISALATTNVADRPDAPARPVAPVASVAGAQQGQVQEGSAVVHLQRSSASVASIGVIGGSVPATLCRMRDIAVATSSGTLTDTDRAKLQAEYTQLSHDVSRAVTASVQQHVQAQAPSVQPAHDADGRQGFSGSRGQGGSQQSSSHRRSPDESARAGRDANPVTPATHHAAATPPAAGSPVAMQRAQSRIAQFHQATATASSALSLHA